MKNKTLMILFHALGTVLLIGSIGMFVIFVRRYNLPYNSEGNYFDTASGVNLQIQAGYVYGMASMITFGTAGFSFLMGKIFGNKNR